MTTAAELFPEDEIRPEALPNGWRRVRLDRVCDLNPRRPAIARADDALTTFVPMPAVSEETGAVVKPEVKPFGEVKKGYTYFAENDVLFAKITPCMQNGKHAIARNLLDGIGFGSTEFHVIRPGPEVLAEWVHAFLRQRSVLRNAMAHFTGSVGQQRVPEDYLAGLEIPLPPVREQQRISVQLRQKMAAVTRAKKAADERHKACERLVPAVLRAAFHGITPITADVTRDAAPRGWRWRKLTDIARLESGHTPSRYHPEWWGGDVPWIALPDIRALDAREAFSTLETTNDLGIENSSARRLPPGTVVLSRTASVGFVTVMGREMATSQDFVNWVCGDELEPWFLAYALMAARRYIRAIASGAVHKTVYMPTAKAFEVCIPDRGPQEAIVREIRKAMAAAEAVTGASRECLTMLSAVPQTLLREAFTGRM